MITKMVAMALTGACVVAAAGDAHALVVGDGSGGSSGTTPRACNTTLNEGKTYTFNPSGGNAGNGSGFNLGFSAGARVVADCNSLRAELPLSVDANLAGGMFTTRPFEVRLTASTNSGGRNAVDIGFYTFGFRVDTYTVAESTVPLTYNKSLDLVLPDRYRAFNYGGQRSISGANMSYSIGYSLVASGSALISAEIAPTGIRTTTTTVGQLRGSVHAEAGVEGNTARIDVPVSVFWFLAGAYGNLTQQNGQWTGAVHAGLLTDEVLKGQWVVSLPIVGSVEVFRLPQPEDFWGDWTVTKPFTKPF